MTSRDVNGGDLSISGIAKVAGRILLASLFLLGAANKIANYSTTAVRMEDVGLSPASILLPATIALELTGGALIAIGRNGARWAALALALFTLATNYFFHDFWTLEGEMRALELSLFFKNMAIAGALLFLAGSVSGGRR